MKDFKEKIKSLWREEKTFTSLDIFRPHRDWKTLIVLSFLVLIALLTFDYLVYRDINNEKMFVEGNNLSGSIERLKTEDMDKVNIYFNGKKEAISSLEKKPLLDPSL
ncbi:MAG: hypothetical protein WC631_03470 [Candidatus Paceibacterota bacterium]|jgi:hypothetical protein